MEARTGLGEIDLRLDVGLAAQSSLSNLAM